MTDESICNICGKPEEITGTDGAGELTYKPHNHCQQPDCKEIGEYDAEVCSEENEDETFDIIFCRKHYIDLLLYNGDNPEDEGIELTEDERKLVTKRLHIEE